jgi:DNA-binding XRE family transcriptional regulator
MTINKNERSYIKQFGRVAMSSRKPQYDEVQCGDEVIGQIETQWSELGSCWIFTGVVFHEVVYENAPNYLAASRLDHNTWDDAHKWIEFKRLELNRHESFGAYVVYMLSDMSMSKTQLGHHLKVSRQSIYDWINNKSLPDVPNYLALARLYAKWMSQDINTTLVDMSESIQ